MRSHSSTRHLLAALGFSVFCSGALIGAGPEQTGKDSIPEAYAHAALRPVDWGDARITGGFLGPFIDRTRDVSVSDLFEKMQKHGSLNNFHTLAEGKKGRYVGHSNEDEWVHKLLEAGGFFAPQSATINKEFQPLISDMLAAQDKDGYLNTFYQTENAPRFAENNRFEFYDFGHYAQAAIAWKRTTGDERLLKSAIKFADLLCDKFGASPLPYNYHSPLANKKYEHPNHEMAMVELYRVTGNRRYLDFASHTLDYYGFWNFPEVYGHCVQENLLLCGGADVYLETGNPKQLKHLELMWKDIVERKSYLTGGVGNGLNRENYGKAYVLPNVKNYSETCASISKVFLGQRMLLATANPMYADEMERILYNAVLSGVSLTGKEYFYVNPMEAAADGSKKRVPYFNTSCCAPNLHRLLGSIQQYLFTSDQGGIQAQLFGNTDLKLTLPSGQTVHLRETTDYPENGRIEFEILADGKFALSLRIPRWAGDSGASVTINGKPGPVAKAGEYVKLERSWKAGDKAVLVLDMKPTLVAGRDLVADEKGKLALMRGPVVYCLESPDNPNVDLFAVSLIAGTNFKSEPTKELGGTVRLTGQAWNSATNAEIQVSAIPYHLWDNRGKSTMRVWFPAKL